ncbi:hypothetical protein [Sphingomonas sp.]|uniref:hypothetical protein n=1 Tax=Sphingomonas sp. TaxID=28214 RepID=UPI002D7F6E0C|nr:hypothetical protein [Sphingomonas sp.]HEU0044570.1 hypothetical protein [Sphingomonas sp.]
MAVAVLAGFSVLHLGALVSGKVKGDDWGLVLIMSIVWLPFITAGGVAGLFLGRSRSG